MRELLNRIKLTVGVDIIHAGLGPRDPVYSGLPDDESSMDVASPRDRDVGSPLVCLCIMFALYFIEGYDLIPPFSFPHTDWFWFPTEGLGGRRN